MYIVWIDKGKLFTTTTSHVQFLFYVLFKISGVSQLDKHSKPNMHVQFPLQPEHIADSRNVFIVFDGMDPGNTKNINLTEPFKVEEYI